MSLTYIASEKVIPGLRVKCALQLLSKPIGEFALLRYLSEFWFRVLTAITSDVS